jgi:hypothetical protein
MGTLLGWILDAIKGIGSLVLVALVDVVNAVILAVGTLISVLFSLLPSLPSPPTVPVADWVGWLNWFFPVAEMIAALTAFVVIWTSFLVIRMALRWVKAL